jgi:hypothetical protein
MADQALRRNLLKVASELPQGDVTRRDLLALLHREESPRTAGSGAIARVQKAYKQYRDEMDRTRAGVQGALDKAFRDVRFEFQMGIDDECVVGSWSLTADGFDGEEEGYRILDLLEKLMGERGLRDEAVWTRGRYFKIDDQAFSFI